MMANFYRKFATLIKVLPREFTTKLALTTPNLIYWKQCSIVRVRGVTLVELMTAIAIMAILLAVAVPSFSSFLSKKRVENAFVELTTDLQFARSEAAQRNTNVRITFGTGCYVIHTVGSTSTSCTQANGVSLGTNAVEIKTVKLDAGSALSFSPNNSLTYLMFDSVRGMATWDGTNPNSATGSVDIASSSGSWQLRASVTPVGRTQACSPNASIGGYPSTSC